MLKHPIDHVIYYYYYYYYYYNYYPGNVENPDQNMGVSSWHIRTFE